LRRDPELLTDSADPPGAKDGPTTSDKDCRGRVGRGVRSSHLSDRLNRSFELCRDRRAKRGRERERLAFAGLFFATSAKRREPFADSNPPAAKIACRAKPAC